MPDPLYATDEDVALRAPADFPLLCPRDQKLACGTDGAFTASDRWTLISSSVDFAAQGVAPGHVVQLLGPPSAFRPPGEALVVAAVNGRSVTLRRKGQAAGAGQPPAPPAGLVGVEFLVATLAPQIASAGAEVRARLAPSAAPSGDEAASVREAVVLTVMCRQYQDMSRDPGGASPDALAAKAQMVRAELDAHLARAEARGRPGDDASTRLAGRICR